MRLLNLPTETLDRVEYYSAAPNGGGQQVTQLDITRMYVDTLPAGLSGLIVTSDLQGRSIQDNGAPGDLVGCLIARHLVDTGICSEPQNTGVLLSGDLFSNPNADQRGATGDVLPVWQSFASHYCWVVGVMGNHDLLPSTAELQDALPNATLLDGNLIERSGLRIGGVGGIVGKLTKPNRKETSLMISLLQSISDQHPDLILTHESPRAYEGRRGNNAIRDWLLEFPTSSQTHPTPLLICGHTHWPQPVATLGNGLQALNVDHRVVVLEQVPSSR